MTAPPTNHFYPGQHTSTAAIADVAAQWDYLDTDPDNGQQPTPTPDGPNRNQQQHVQQLLHVQQQQQPTATTSFGSGWVGGVHLSSAPKPTPDLVAGQKANTVPIQVVPARHDQQVVALASSELFGGKKRRKQSLVSHANSFSVDDVGKSVTVIDYHQQGVIRFVGPHHETGETRVGVEMDQPVPKGTVGIFRGLQTAHKYFHCRKGRGLLLFPENLLDLAQSGGNVDVTKKATEIFHMHVARVILVL